MVLQKVKIQLAVLGLAVSIATLIGCSVLSEAALTDNNPIVTPPMATKVENSAPVTSTIPIAKDIYAQQRPLFVAAQKAWASGNRTEYEQLKMQLRNYPLLDHLEFNEIHSRLSQLPFSEIDTFFERYPNSVTGVRLRYRLLQQLALKERWKDYLAYYDPAIQETEYRCNYLRARLLGGDKTALKETGNLWNVDYAQIKSCDPLFALWRQQGGQTSDLVWQRFLKVSMRQDKNLAAYLSRQLPAPYQAAAKRIDAINANAQTIRLQSNWPTTTQADRDVINFGLDRLSRINAENALFAWKKYEGRSTFTVEERKKINKNIAIRYLFQKNDAGARALAVAHPDIREGDLIEWILRERLRVLDFESLYEWISYLPVELQQHERWQYWKARSMEELSIHEEQGVTAKEIYQKLSLNRSYYGFVSSDILKKPYSMQDIPVTFTQAEYANVANNASIKRAREFYLLNDTLSANREWNYALRKFSEKDKRISGPVAVSWEWYRQGIQSMIQGNYWDDLLVRFPTQYKDIVTANAKSTKLDETFIFSIIRQESAFIPDVKSPVGATGLMQLMPATAAQTAKRYNIAYTPNDLIVPSKNIALGSRYLHQMMAQFDNNRLLTAAAYNAGPNRAKQWLTIQANLPHDVWVETIPFRETRGYVQNVLCFSLIYAYRLDKKASFMTKKELSRKL